MRLLSLGAGIQSTALLLMSEDGIIPPWDAALFADTGWEPAEVYSHLERLDAATATPIVRLSVGNIRDDALDPAHGFASLPLYVVGPNGDGMGRRQCTNEYKLKPLKRAVRERLGYPHPRPVPRGLAAELGVGISADEADRARDSDVGYIRNVFPLLELEWTRKDCIRYLDRRGWGDTPKSACIGCPFHSNRQWRRMRDAAPDEWADAVAFDNAIRHARPGTAQYLHRQRVPLAQANIDRVTRAEHVDAQVDMLDLLADMDPALDVPGCSPFACREIENVSPAGDLL